MKKTLCSTSALRAFFYGIALLLMTTQMSWGQSLLVDNFTGTVGTALTANGWTLHSGSGTPFLISSPSLTYTSYTGSGIGNAASTGGTSDDINKSFTSTNTGSLYMSFMYKPTSASTTTDYPVMFGTTTGAAVTVFGGKFYVQKDASNNLRFGITKTSAASASYTGYSYALNTTYLIVIRYDFVAGATNDVAYLFVNPILGTTEPTPTVTMLTDTAADPAQLISVALRQSNTTAGATYGGLKVGKTWADITPAAVTITAPTLTTPTATAITDISATLGATVTSDGGASLTARGTAYKTATGVIATDNSLAEGGTDVTAFSHSRTGLMPQNQYFYAGYATNSAGTGLSSEGSFRTWSSPPTAQAASLSGTGFSTTQVDLTMGTAAAFPTSDATQGGYLVIYASGASPTFTATNGTAPSAGVGTIFTTTATGLPTAPATAISVTGLVAATSYNFLVVPYTWDGTNASTYNYLTTSAPTATASTTSGATVSWCNVQSPTSQALAEGSTFNVYAQAYQSGLTEAAGAGTGLSAWIGYSSSNVNPNSGTWTWVPASFNTQVGNNDEFVATLGSGVTPGTYYYASRFQIGTGPYAYGGTAGVWSSDNATLTVNSNIVDYCNVQYPALGTITVGGTFDVYTQVYEPGITDAVGQGSGISAELGYSTENTNPNSVSGWTWFTSTYNTDSENNDEYKTEIGLGRAIGTYYYASRFKKTGSTEYVYGGTNGSPWTTSGTLTVNAVIPVVTAASPTGTYNAVFSYNILASNSPTSYAISSGTLPAYLSLNTTTGAITGTPSAAESFSVNVTATNSGGTSAPATLSFTIAKASQSITFAALANKTTIDLPFALAATASSALAVTYASSNEAVATISGSTVTIVGAGSTNITASQAGDSNYNAATDVVHSLIVELPPLVTFDFASISGSELSVNSNSNVANIAASTITRGVGLTAATNADRFNATNWALTSIANAISGNNYVEFTISPNVGHMFSVSSILFQLQRSSTGFTAIALRSSVDNYATNLDAEKTVVDNISTQSFTFTFAQNNSQVPVIYRLYGYAESTGGSGGPGDGTGNDIVVTGTVSCSTPTAYAVTGGNVCTPSGVMVGLASSQVGVSYQLKLDGTNTGDIAVQGETGVAKSFGSHTAVGTYTVEATNVASGCSTTATMTGSAVISPVTVSGTVTGGTTICSGSTSGLLTLGTHTGAIVRWESSVSPFDTWTPIANTLDTYTSGELTETTQFRAVVQSGACLEGSAGVATVTIVACTYIPDANFEQALIDLTLDSGPIDHYVLTANISGVTNLDVSGLDIQDLTGIEGFTSLDELICENNLLPSLDVSALSTLRNLSMLGNRLVNASDLKAHPYLTYLDCDDNLFTSIDVSGLTNLKQFYCNNNKLTSLNVKGLSLTNFECKVNPLLTCILVDNVADANTAATTVDPEALVLGDHFWAKDATASYLTFACGTITWNGSAWNNAVGATASDEAIIAGNFSTSLNTGLVSAKKLTVNSGILTVKTGTNLTVQNEVVNTGGSIVVENNANLIQVNNTTNSGSITVNRDSNALYRSDYAMWSSPVADQNLLAFSPLTSVTPLSRFYTYNSTDDTYENLFNAANTAFAKGIGYLIRMPNTDPASGYDAGTTLIIYPGVFTGVPNNGDVTLTVSSGNYYAIGNPYPSTISADAFITDNNISEALYFWRKRNNPIQATAPTTSYATYTLAGATGTSPSTLSGITPNGTIQVGQGFIAKSTSATLVFTNTMRTANNSNQILRTKAVERNRIWVNLTNPAGAFSQMMVAYMTGATQGIDAAIDGRYFNDSAMALNSYLNNEEFVIQGRALPFDGTDTVPLAFKTDVAGDYTIAIDHVDGLFSGSQDIFLRDNTTGIETDLKAGAYAFTAAVGVDNTRFSLKYQKTLNVNAPTFNANSVTVYKNKGTLYVNSGNVTMANIKVFDIQGRLIAEQKNVKANTAAIKDLKTAQQVLIVKITAQDNSVVSKKVVN